MEPDSDPSEKIKSLSEAKAKLEQDVERLEAALNAERFGIFAGITTLFDAFIFRDYNTSTAPLALVAVEFAGLFVLARRLGVDEVVYLTFEVLKSWRKSPGSSDSDPPESTPPTPTSPP